MAWIKISRANANVKLLSVMICQPCILYHQPHRGLAESSDNHYNILGLKPTASPSQIKSAYYSLSKKYHPDVAVGVDDAKEKFARLSTAYEVLSSPDKRAVYDRSLFSIISSHTASPPGSGIDSEYREFLRRRGTFHPRASGQASSSSTAGGRIRYDYEEFFRQQYYGRTMRENWEPRQNLENRRRQNQAAAGAQSLWLFVMMLTTLCVIACSGDK